MSSLILILAMVAIDTYVFMALRTLLVNLSPKWRVLIFGLYWLASAIVIFSVIFYSRIPWEKFMEARSYYLTFAFGLFFAKALIVVFLLADDGRRAVMWVYEKFTSAPAAAIAEGNREVQGITRSQFLLKTGFLLGGTMLGTLLYGLSNKYNYHVRKIRLTFNNLPAAFKGLKIVQISDVHSGSFTDKAAVVRGIELIKAQNPDLILFTGDLVNDKADEMDEYLAVFNQLQAPLGVYSTLGNHDYGDYYPWPDYDENRHSPMKVANLERLKNIHGQMGWKLLMNEHTVLEKNGDKIALLGVENWSMNPRFPRKGDLAAAYAGSEEIPFKILLSHDPTHWDGQVRPNYRDIDLMLAGHTHGMQFGLEIPFFKWSPAQYIYKQWAGLYQDGKQRLYVNRGFGFLGYPGRVGILPEITVIELA
ncbi:metallophosphoesterase [Chitinophaga sp. GCM10012297]|uniref:Metallophosphoesterase n=1 Tax=Chitinophaga chungangae TaxID=2821488 RepID=A0ABS3YL44_9BACT|nr:metallophosphoesterase [Chitinophaga chungangae]MBO9155413.1 metallophosphoesterase [Chitinophaga chungangae]